MIIEFNDIEYDCDIKKPSEDKFFKVNLPRTIEDYNTGNGEGVWAYCKDEDRVKLEGPEKFFFVARILNDSVYYEDLKYGDPVLCYYNGDGLRPVANIHILIREYGYPISDDEYMEHVMKIFICRQMQADKQ